MDRASLRPLPELLQILVKHVHFIDKHGPYGLCALIVILNRNYVISDSEEDELDHYIAKYIPLRGYIRRKIFGSLYYWGSKRWWPRKRYLIRHIFYNRIGLIKPEKRYK